MGGGRSWLYSHLWVGKPDRSLSLAEPPPLAPPRMRGGGDGSPFPLPGEEGRGELHSLKHWLHCYVALVTLMGRVKGNLVEGNRKGCPLPGLEARRLDNIAKMG